MLKKAPTASAIRAANRNAVGGGPKRCRKGKNCSATCIDAGKDCLVGLPEPVSVATTKVAKMLQERQGGAGGTAAAAPQAAPSGAPSLQDLSKRISQAREEYEDAYGTPKQAAAKAKFDKAVADYENAKNAAKAATAAPATAKAAPAATPTLDELSKRVTETGKEWARLSGTPGGAAAKAEFEKAKQDYQNAKDAAAAAKTPDAASTLAGLKQAANPTSTRGLTWDQDEKVDNAARMTNYRIEKKLNERQFYDDETNAKIRAQNEKVVAPFQKLNEDEKAALALYGQDGVKYYAQVNQLLRKGQMEDSTPDKVRMAEFISANLRGGLEKLPPAKVEELQRAISGNTAQGLGKLKVGDVIEDKGFGSYTDKGSTTLNQFIKADRPNAVIRVLNPKSAREVAPVMEYNAEGEHISLPGTKYRLVSIDQEGFYSRKVGYVPQYTFEEVSE